MGVLECIYKCLFCNSLKVVTTLTKSTQKHLIFSERFIYKIRFNVKIHCKCGKTMEVAITKLSENGQVVIPAEIRRDAGIRPSTKFLVFNEGGNILLKMIRKETLAKDIHLLEMIERSEEHINAGRFTKANTSMSDEEIDDLLMH